MTHKVRGRMRSSAVLRDFIHVGTAHIVYSTLNAVATIGSVAGYIQGTYYEQKGRDLSVPQARVQNLLLVWFAFIFFFELFIAYDRIEHVKKLVTICDFLSVLPILTLVFSALGVDGATLEFLSMFRAFRVLRFLRLHRLLSFYRPGIMRQVMALLLIIFCSLLVLTGCVYQLEGLHDIDGQSQFTERLSFFEAFYFVIITFTTVGYGDIYPQQIISRIIVAAAVPIMIIIVPTLGKQIFDLVASKSAYACHGKIHTHGDWHHIVVVGDLGADETTLGRQLPVLLEQLYHPERGSVDIELQVVLLQNEDPPGTVKNRVLQHPYYSERVQWVTGSAFEDAHLRHWVAGDRAVCFINLANDEVPSIEAKQHEDNAAVQRALVIRRTFPKVRLITQLLLERNLHRLHGERCELVCVEQLKYAMLGRSVRVPALHTLLAGLLVAGSGKVANGASGFDSISRTFSEELTRALDVSYVPTYRNPLMSLKAARTSVTSWLRCVYKGDDDDDALDARWGSLSSEEELAKSAHATVHEVSAIPAKVIGQRFDMVARTAYLHFGVLPVAVSTDCSLVGGRGSTAADSAPSPRAPRTSSPWIIFLDGDGEAGNRTRGSAHVVNFPYDYRLQAGDTLLVIANDTAAVNDFETWADFEEREKALDAVWDTHLFPQLARRSTKETSFAEKELALRDALDKGVDDYEAALKRLSGRAHIKLEKSHRSLQSLLPTGVASHADHPHHHRKKHRVFKTIDDDDGDEKREDADADLAKPPPSSGDLTAYPADSLADISVERSSVDSSILEPSSPPSPTCRGRASPVSAALNDPPVASKPFIESTPQVAMAACAEIEQWSESERLNYFSRWFATHVVNECPRDLEDHVVFCGSTHSLMCFLQPLMFANIEWNTENPKSQRSLPRVVVLDPLLDSRAVFDDNGNATRHVYKENARFEACTFYEQDADGPPTRLWIVPGDPRESRCHAGHPTPLERVGVARADVFVMPNSQINALDLENLGGDDFTVRVVRNVQETVARERGEPLDRPWKYDRSAKPRLLVEMHDAGHSEYLRNSPPYSQLETSGQIVLPSFTESAVVNVYHSSAALPFTHHAMCSWRDDGLLYHERLRDGIVRESCHVSLVDVPQKFHGQRYLKFFDYCNAHAALPIALLRVPHGETRRDLAYVYTTPRPYDYIHTGDRAFVLATSVWFGNADLPGEDELEACVNAPVKRESAIMLPISMTEAIDANRAKMGAEATPRKSGDPPDAPRKPLELDGREPAT